MYYLQRNDIAALTGKVLKEVTTTDDTIIFITECDKQYKMYHAQDCCESVWVESIEGDWDDIIGYEIKFAEQRDSDNEKAMNDWDESFTWTFYTIATIKGYMDIRWYGSSNGYYSEAVDFIEIK